jgi:tetratricopeptide (TPR) repeat protein
MPLFTPAYASPEQMRGDQLTTASDVYSLGVILYELLAGRSPYGARGQSFVEVWTAVCERTPEPPSSAGTVGHRYRNATDLDAIVLMALRKEPEQRYAGADALGEDLERYLAGMPVRARQGNATYYVRRFVARHKWAVLGGTAALIAVCVSAGVVVWEQRIAALRFEQLRRFANSVVFELHDAIEPLPGSTSARKLLVQRSLEYLRSLEASSGRDLRLKWELAEAYKRIADAQGNPGRANLGDGAGALDSYGRARGLLHQILAADPGNRPTLSTLAAIDRPSADILSDNGKPSDALVLRREAMDALRQLAARSPTPEARKALALSRYSLPISLNEIQNWPEATREWRETLRLYEEIARTQPGGMTLSRNVALCQKRLASVYFQRDDFAQAIVYYRAAERIDRARLAAEPRDPEAKMDLSFDLSDLGLALCSAGRYSEAVVEYESALELRRELAAEDSADYRAQSAVGRSLDRLAGAYELAGVIGRAIETSREATSRLAAVQMRYPANQGMTKETALAFEHLGKFYRARASSGKPARNHADWHDATAAFERASILFRDLGNAIPVTQTERETLQSIPGSLQECRTHLASRR